MSYRVCDKCGHDMFYDTSASGHVSKTPMKTQGWLTQEDGVVFNICSVCLQVEVTINKDSLYERGYRKLVFGNMDATKETAKYEYEVLAEEPWLKQVKPSEGERGAKP